MANITPTLTNVGPSGDGSTILAIWGPFTESDACLPISYPAMSDKSVHVYGTFGSASVAVQGSNNGTSFAALNDPTGTVIAITTERIKAILENTMQIKPVATGGTGQSITVAILMRLANPLRQ